jgi:hypothetical protein
LPTLPFCVSPTRSTLGRFGLISNAGAIQTRRGEAISSDSPDRYFECAARPVGTHPIKHAPGRMRHRFMSLPAQKVRSEC